MARHIFTDAERITVLDQRFYRFNNSDVYYPSVTTILQAYPKGQFFEQWLKDNGADADDIRDKAGQQGTNVHNAIETYLSGDRVAWAADDSLERAQYTLNEWQMFCKFVEWYEVAQPKIEAIEATLCNEQLQFGGTLDCVCIIDGKRWLLDWKTSNMLHKTYELQLAAYTTAWNLTFPDKKIDEVGILWLNTKTRGADKTGKKMQGAGWQVATFDRPIAESFRLFQYTQKLWQEENPNYKPKNLSYPVEFCLKK
jgi:hypothetical protein